jgi:predicted membrane-bound spermidine synthase
MVLPTTQTRLPVLLLSAVFFVSGAAALIFETLWFRQSGLALGNSVWASSLVLASFMAGLTLGNGLAARYGEQIRHRLAVYAGLELLIAVTGIGLVLVLPLLAGWLAPLFRGVAEHLWLANALRLGFSFLLLMLPATAMGATLPIVVKEMTRWDRSFGSVLGRLYGWNTLGAVAGAVAGEAVLIAALGVRGTALFAAGCNLLAAGCALVLARRAATSPLEDGSVPVAPPRRVALSSRAMTCCAAAFFSGAILLAFEVVWFRFLHLFVHGGSLAFALMLATVLAGIGLGGVTGGLWLRRDPRADRHATAVALVAGAVAAATYGLFRFAVEPHGAPYVSEVRGVLYFAAVLTLPTSFLSGLLFTQTGAMLQRIVGPEARSAGLLTLSNTAGAGLGPLVAGFVLLPTLGMERSFFLLGASYASVALLLFAARTPRPSFLRPATGWIAAILFVVALITFPFGLLQDLYIPMTVRRVTEGVPMQVVAFREGRSETLTYLRSDFLGEPLAYKLVTDGFSMAGTFLGARRYMKLFVYWPLALGSAPQQALLISYGTGSTAKALVETPSLERIDVVDISREIFEMSDVVHSDPQRNPLNDERVRVHIEDGRYFLRRTEQRYGLITGEPPPPKMGGVVYLYTSEYFSLIHDRLEPGGLCTYWLPVVNLTLADAQTIIRAYCDVFADCSLWTGHQLNWMLAGSREGGWHGSEASFRRQWNEPEAGAELRTLGFELPEQIGATFLADAEMLAELTRGAPPLTDNHPKRLSNFRASEIRGAEVFRSWMDTATTAMGFANSRFIRAAWPEDLRRRSRDFFDHQRMINEIYAQPPLEKNAKQKMQDLHVTLTATPLRTLVLWQLGMGSDEMRIVERLSPHVDSTPQLRYASGVRSMALRDFDAAAGQFATLRSSSGHDPRALQLELYALCMAGRREEAQALVSQLGAQRATTGIDRDYWEWMGQTFDFDVEILRETVH